MDTPNTSEAIYTTDFPEVSCQDTEHISKQPHPDSKEAERETCILICHNVSDFQQKNKQGKCNAKQEKSKQQKLPLRELR